MITNSRYNDNAMQENTYVLLDKATGVAVIIDPGCYPKEMKEFLKEATRVDCIVLTHGHADHMLCINEIKADYEDVKVIANINEKPLLNNAAYNGSANIYGVKIEFDADIYVDDGDTYSFGESTLKFISTPGHSPGGMCILASDGLLYSGDTLFERSIGRSDLYGGDAHTLIESIKNKIFTLPDDTPVFPGHGAATCVLFEKKDNPFV